MNRCEGPKNMWKGFLRLGVPSLTVNTSPPAGSGPALKIHSSGAMPLWPRGAWGNSTEWRSPQRQRDGSSPRCSSSQSSASFRARRRISSRPSVAGVVTSSNQWLSGVFISSTRNGTWAMPNTRYSTPRSSPSSSPKMLFHRKKNQVS